VVVSNLLLVEPVFLQPGEGERIAGDETLGVALLADVEQIGIAEVRAEPSGGGPPMHLHARHAECFFVREGQLTFRLEGRELQAMPGSWVCIPPEVVHTFAVTGDGRAHFLNIHVPSRGFGGFVRGLHSARDDDELRAVRAAFDQQPAPECGGADPGSVIVRTSASAETVEVSGNRIAFLARAEETGGAIGAIEFTAPHAFEGPPPHVHRELCDIVVVLEGTPSVWLGDEAYTAGPGTFVLAPPGVPHTFSNPADEPLRFLDLYVPGGFEGFFSERAAAAADGPLDPAVASEITSRYDWERA
jgi:mannose-6-phosphate isomerase-like protein (cupin superfamily)